MVREDRAVCAASVFQRIEPTYERISKKCTDSRHDEPHGTSVASDTFRDPYVPKTYQAAERDYDKTSKRTDEKRLHEILPRPYGKPSPGQQKSRNRRQGHAPPYAR